MDTPPELRLQLVRAGVRRVDAVWYTHCHADHTHGVDDLRVFSVRESAGRSEVYGSEECVRPARGASSTTSSTPARRSAGTTKPEAELRVLHAYEPVEVGGIPHAPAPRPARARWRCTASAWATWGTSPTPSGSPTRTLEALRGVRVLVLNALWFGRAAPHPLHRGGGGGGRAAVGAEHDLPDPPQPPGAATQELLDRLPPGILPAYDGLEVTL